MSADGLGRYPVRTSIVVAWGEMDAYQHVNNVTYVRWAETARINYFNRLRLMEMKEERGVGPILAKVSVDYRRPVTYPDTVVLETTVKRLGTSSFTLSNRMTSEAQGAVVAETEEVVVNFDYRANRTVPLSDDLRAEILALEASGPAR